ncbi:nitrite reductase [Dichomitus squalens LYAD-421 SS1]|uniref:Nitrite reductase [NAD(P)H] n=1 Tax=Dichomitus squalens (strain LYAD-421) TaxID=732165 RepID=R7SRW0_DICSQ|nr:nitrite reductase [Dichomitus squalens LYAD-421 SS1]EJF58500.1 nitrite reductase [Dichomitus squalens LYAD-421 SS1]
MGPDSDIQTIVVVGLGMVGIAFIGKLLSLDTSRRYRIVTCGEEVHLAYNRVALTDYFQHRNVEKLYLESPDWYENQDPAHFEFYTGETVVALDTTARTVTTDTGRSIAYDHCVLATGSDATLPSYADTAIPGVFVYRNITDVNKLLAYAEKEDMKDASVVVLGGGLLGLEAAKAVHDLPTISDVTIVHRSAYPLSRQLDAQGGEIVLRRIEGMGVRFLGSTSATRLISDSSTGALTGLELMDGTVLPCTIAVFAIGITPRDDLARKAGLACVERGGIVVDDRLRTSAEDVYAIGECASWKGNTYGLIAPGIEMAEILAFNFTQAKTDVGEFKPREMNNPDLSTKLKLMGVDVASFGDFFVEQRVNAKSSTTHSHVGQISPSVNSSSRHDASAPKKRHGGAAAGDGPVEALTYRDPFVGVYKRYIFSADGRYILGGMMVGDTSDYVKLVALVKKKKPLEIPPSQFILGSRSGREDAGDDLDEDAQICSCHNVSKGQIVQCIKDGAQGIADVKTRTKAGSGCGGCVPLMTNIVKAEMKKAGIAVSNNLCPHFAMSRVDLFNVVKIKKLKTMTEIMAAVGVKPDSVGCETCKPAVGSILSSLWNEHIFDPAHNSNQDTNDRFLANIQRNGTFSVVPRVAAGEITPDKLVILGQTAKKYGLYTKITGGQRIDLFGAERADLPSIWKELVDAGFESGHAYGKALRTVKSCVGTSWCRYGIGDAVGMAIRLEERYKGIRSPHKFKGGVSGCVRECAEAQSKDFGLIATDKGWNVFVCGNGGANPRHATLLASDVPPSRVVQIIDRFIMYYIRTADKLMRTARWLESMEGGIEVGVKLRKVILDDELGICEDLEREMDGLVGSYFDEWKSVVDSPEQQKRFRQFVNTNERVDPMEKIVERGQMRPANWSKTTPSLILRQSDIPTPKDQWMWRTVAKVQDLILNEGDTTSAAVRYGDSQIAIYHVLHKGYFATQQMCPHRRAFVLDHGIVGDDPGSNALYISCPMHKRNFSLTSGECLNDSSYGIIVFDVKTEGDDILLLLPEPDDLNGVIGTAKWMVSQATAELLDRTSATGGENTLEIAGPTNDVLQGVSENVAGGGCSSGSYGDSKLDW